MNRRKNIAFPVIAVGCFLLLAACVIFAVKKEHTADWAYHYADGHLWRSNATHDEVLYFDGWHDTGMHEHLSAPTARP